MHAQQAAHHTLLIVQQSCCTGSLPANQHGGLTDRPAVLCNMKMLAEKGLATNIQAQQASQFP